MLFLLFSFTIASLVSAQFLSRNDSYIFAPSSKILRPSSVHTVRGQVTGPDNLLLNATNSSGTTVFVNGSSVTYDFGVDIAGWVHFNVTSSNEGIDGVAVAFTESSSFISDVEGDAVVNNITAPLLFNLTGTGSYAAPDQFLRGAFRYLTFIAKNISATTLSVSDLHVNYSAMPHWDDLRAYPGYFISNDDTLNRVWYAGAYTLQLCTIPPQFGDALVPLILLDHSVPYNSYSPLIVTLSNGSSVITDGARRDRLVWPGDMMISVPSVGVSTADSISIRNAIDSLFTLQNADGVLPYAGVGFPFQVSDTYHLYSLIAVYNYWLWTGDVDWVGGKWEGWKKGMNWSLGNVDSGVGLMNVTSSSDWLRFGMGRFNGEANSILYYTLGLGLTLASVMNDTSVVSTYTSTRNTLAQSLDAHLWNQEVGLYNDNTTSNLNPQDGNVWAILADLTQDNSTRILEGLQKRWTKFGPPAVEAANAISPFISSLELHANLLSNRTSSALQLIRDMWGSFMLDDPRMTGSTLIEGYSSDGSTKYAPYPEVNRVSYAHGWSSGPTSGLTNDIAGMKILSAAGQEWIVKPQIGDLTAVSAGFNTTLGSFEVAWSRTNTTTLLLRINTPKGTTGTVAIPTLVDEGRGVASWSLEGEGPGGEVVDTGASGEGKFEERFYVGMRGVKGGVWNVRVEYSESARPNAALKKFHLNSAVILIWMVLLVYF